ncbi:metallophosphoesterase [Rhodococcus sp. NPDC058639]|uniref:metallophosphoesterase n=1 Tax=Rhodococcus sp. NPDC058639 TaxID=3346570 RepID=UPI0036506ACA
MNEKVAIIGDIHGNRAALTGILGLLDDWKWAIVFVGDYVDRGNDSAGVIDDLIDLSKSRDDTHFIAGNHDLAMKEAISSGNLFPFLSIGGATTIKSYVSTPREKVIEQLRQAVPDSHLEFLRNLIPCFVTREISVAHTSDDPIFEQSGSRYRVYGHTPTDDRRPRITENFAAIDTGCGSLPDGRLTCFLWPERGTLQVDATGHPVPNRP